MNRQDSKLEVFVKLAEHLADLSMCKRQSVGCVIVPKDLTGVYAIGYNGPAAGLPNDSCSEDEGNCGCIHAEANAIAKLSILDKKCLLITTTSPCSHCAGLIINCGRVSEVLYSGMYRDLTGITTLKSVGIVTRSYERSERCLS